MNPIFWFSRTLYYLGDVILIGSGPETTNRMGLKRAADSIAEMLRITQPADDPSPSATYVCIPLLFMCEVS